MKNKILISIIAVILIGAVLISLQILNKPIITGEAGAKYWIKTYTLTHKQFQEGINLRLIYRQKVRFMVDGQYYHIGIFRIPDYDVTMRIEPLMQEAAFLPEDEKYFDLTEDGEYDLYVRLNSIENKVVNITIRKV